MMRTLLHTNAECIAPAPFETPRKVTSRQHAPPQPPWVQVQKAAPAARFASVSGASATASASACVPLVAPEDRARSAASISIRSSCNHDVRCQPRGNARGVTPVLLTMTCVFAPPRQQSYHLTCNVLDAQRIDRVVTCSTTQAEGQCVITCAVLNAGLALAAG